jgi:hypothetical protein
MPPARVTIGLIIQKANVCYFCRKDEVSNVISANKPRGALVERGIQHSRTNRKHDCSRQ